MTDRGQNAGPFTPTASLFRVPLATYRLQLNREFTFRQADELIDYLHELGISDCYASPIYRARSGSGHGYDVCDCTMLNPELGSSEEFARWTDRLRAQGMGLLLDVVPNHMAADSSNPWWWDVLENGLSSTYAGWFDIDWHSPHAQCESRVILPILEDHYFRELESGKLRVVLETDGFSLVYQQHRFPLSPVSRRFLQDAILHLSSVCEQIEPLLLQINRATRTAKIDRRVPVGAGIDRWEERSKERDGIAGARAEVERALARFNGEPGVASTFDLLHSLLQQQHYRLAYWRLAGQQINYRRFFDVSGLVSMRMELPEVFEATHRLTLELLRERRVTGLRIDHTDGLWNPNQYFDRLQQVFSSEDDLSPNPTQQQHTAAKAGRHSRKAAYGALYVVAEKILGKDEDLPSNWRVVGTTGYDFLNQLNGLFINGDNGPALEALYREVTGQDLTFEEAAYAGKKKILQTLMSGDVHALAVQLKSLARQTRYGMDFSLTELQEALTAIVAAFPVYRTYMTEESAAPTPAEAGQIRQALESSSVKSEITDPEVLSFLGGLLNLTSPPDLDTNGRALCRKFVMRFQQLTGPVMAKGVEDTAFYNFNPFISLNEVGGDPGCFGTSLHAFHDQNIRRAQRWPHSLLATATHDTKRGEDLRARLNVLSEIPDEWGRAVMKWRGLNAGKKTKTNGKLAPSSNDEYLLYQTLIGAWGTGAEREEGRDRFRERVSEYMLKAVREAKSETQWTEPDRSYEEALKRFIGDLLCDSESNSFLDDFMLFQRKVAFFGLFNSLAQIVLKLTAPGVPDIYQGTELWDYHLVDPDNRRPVNYRARRKLLQEMRQKLSQDSVDLVVFLTGLLQNHQNGQIKMYLIWRILRLRAQRKVLFEKGGYAPLLAVGAKKDHICAFMRSSGNESVITVAARLVLTLAQGAHRGALDPAIWQDTALPVASGEAQEQYHDILTQRMITVRPNGGGLAVRDVLGLLPVAVLERVK